MGAVRHLNLNVNNGESRVVRARELVTNTQFKCMTAYLPFRLLFTNFIFRGLKAVCMVKKTQESSTAIRQAQVRLVVKFYLVFFALGFMLFTPILIYHWWGNSPAFVSEMYVKKKSWKYDINIEEEEEYEDCDMDDNCTTETRWVTVVSKSNQGDYRQEPSWPDIRSVQSGEREVRQGKLLY